MNEMLQTARRELATLDRDASTLRDEAERVSRQLAKVTDKLEKVRAVVLAYEGESSEPGPEMQPHLFNPPAVAPLEPNAEARRRARLSNGHYGRPESKATLVRNAVTEFLSERGTAHRNEILTMLTAKCIMGHEKTPLASLAAYLSDFREDFESVGRGIFALRSDSSEPHPAVTDDAGPVEAANSGLAPEPALNTEIVVADERQVVHDNIT